MTDSKMQLDDWLDDLCVRFIINLPAEDLSSVERICFHVEEAQWFYEDFIRPLDASLPSMNLRTFCLRIFAHCPLLSIFSHEKRIEAFEEFMGYKRRIPVRGAILLNEAMDSVLLVKGWKKSANWSFPRGKIAKDEDDLDCAIREVLEETGYDIRASGLLAEGQVPKSEVRHLRENQMQMFFFRGVPMDTHFEPQTRMEISKIEWWKLSDLPGFRKNRQQQNQSEAASNPNKFYMVAPFLAPLKKWISDQRKLDSRRSASTQYLSGRLVTDELFTEEDQVTDSNIQESDYGSQRPMSGTGILEGTTAELTRLLKSQPPTQGLQAEAISGIQSSASKNTGKGNELLAILHGTSLPSSSNVPPQTPRDLIYTQAPMPKTPHYHHHPAPPHFSSMPPPPTFPVEPKSAIAVTGPDEGQTSLHYGQTSHAQYQRNVIPGYGQSQGGHQQVSRPQQNFHSYQTPPLVHPQPLPPNVQKAVFTGASVHSPAIPKQLHPQYVPSNPVQSTTAQIPQFPGLHAPMVPPMVEQASKLTQHSLALLNAFKSRDQASNDLTNTNDLPLRRYAQEPIQSIPPQPQELHAETSQLKSSSLTNHIGTQQNVPSSTDLSKTLARPPISGAQKSTLLEIFKSPTTASSAPAPIDTQHSTLLDLFKAPGQPVEPPAVDETQRSTLLGMFKGKVSPSAESSLPSSMTATALPTTSGPSAVELSAVEPLSQAALASRRITEKRATHDGLRESVPEFVPEAKLPFRATAILTRTPQQVDQVGQIKNSAERKTHSNRQKSAAPSASKKASIRKKSPQKPAEKPFQPQILKRPQPPLEMAAEPPAAVSPPFIAKPVSPKLKSPPVDQKQALLSMVGKAQPASSPIASYASPGTPLSRQTSQPGEHTQKLLSLFGKVPQTAAPPLRTQSKDDPSTSSPLDTAAGPSGRPRVGSLASGAGESRRGSQAPISPAEKTPFLLNYLDNIAKGSQH